MRLQGEGFVVRAVAQILGEVLRGNDLAWVEDVVRVKGFLHLAEGLIKFRPVEALVPARAREAVAVFTGHRPAHPLDDRKHFLANAFHAINAGL